MTQACLLAVALSLQAAAPAPIRPGANIPYPVKVKDVKPVYPPDALRARVSGVVGIEVTIGEDGRVRDAVVKRSIPLLDQAAIDAVRQWEFTPTIVDGKPVPIIVTVTVSFAMQGVSPVGSQAAGPPPPLDAMVRLTSTRLRDGSWIVWEITSGRAAAFPHVNPEESQGPLSPNDAMRRARLWIIERYPQAQRLELQTVVWSRVRRSFDVDFWYYQIDFFGYDAAGPVGPLMKAVVLPDGSLVEPRTEPPGAGG